MHQQARGTRRMGASLASNNSVQTVSVYRPLTATLPNAAQLRMPWPTDGRHSSLTLLGNTA